MTEKRDVIPEEVTTHFRSVIAFGKVRLVSDPDEKRAAMYLLGRRFAAGYEKMWAQEIEDAFARTAVLEFTIEHLTGKECIELVKKRKQ